MDQKDMPNLKKPKVEDKQDEEMFQALCCSICCEIIHDCVALQPCGHCFCAGCFSGWMQRSHCCPECRLKTKRVAKNHRMNNLIEIYLQSHPDKTRSDNDIKRLDAENKFTTDIYLLPKRDKTVDNVVGSTDSDVAEDSESSDEEIDDEEPANQDEKPAKPTPSTSNQQAIPVVISRTAIAVGAYYSPMQVPICSQCSNYGKAPYTIAGNLIRPSTRPDVPKYVCTAQQAHLMCHCCRTFIPDRRKEPVCVDRPMECKICNKTFCHLYFGCSRYGCHGCLNRFKDFSYDEMIYLSIVNGNLFESGLLKKYLDDAKLSRKDFLQQCMSKLDSGEFDCKDRRAFNLKSDTVVCFHCALSNIRDLAYEYRKSIPAESALPKRENCWYGRNCRTQRKPHHAEKLNHICEQTRFD